ncbi:MAG: glycoside hydrolase family 15 protein [Oligoflexia bacterium]|nr:glycoside hydrolase family 15 protein [Oligoflexia bacterium]
MSLKAKALAISDYGLISNLRTVALIGKNASIDWLCIPRFDSPSVFATILDQEIGGYCKISIRDGVYQTQDYIPDTNILKTVFSTKQGTVTITDFMPLIGNINQAMNSFGPGRIYRIIECEEVAEIEIEWRPRLNYAKTETETETKTKIRETQKGWKAEDGENYLILNGTFKDSPSSKIRIQENTSGLSLFAHFKVEKNKPHILSLDWDDSSLTQNKHSELYKTIEHFDPQKIFELLKETTITWSNWAHGEDLINLKGQQWESEWHSTILRSKLLLKALDYAYSGAFIAAPTTSLPEEIGGTRNWDYRYVWIRDAALTIQALMALGHKHESFDFLDWINQLAIREKKTAWKLQVLYTVSGDMETKEVILPHLKGYRDSRPVRIGNEASNQFQLGIYGEFINALYELIQREKKIQEAQIQIIKGIAHYVCQNWRNADRGIWEIRGEPRHFVYSKVLAWVALDKTIKLDESFHFTKPSELELFKKERLTLKNMILKHGYNRKLGSFVQSFDSNNLDAANLRIPLFGLLPFEDARIHSTIDRTKEKLMENGFVYRYRDDSLPGKEGAFILCTLWLADALALTGRLEEAREIYQNVIGHTNHLGLLSEQIDPKTKEFLGNFPQAFSHIGVINSALYLTLAEGKNVPPSAFIGETFKIEHYKKKH